MNKQAIYDFDGTITFKDTTIYLLAELLKLRPWRFPVLIWFLLRMIIVSDIVSKQEHKNKAIGYMIKGLNDIRLSRPLRNFSNKVKLLYRPSVLLSMNKAIQGGCTIIIVTASPSFAINKCICNFPSIVLGTEFEKKGNIYSGLLKSKNCYGREKVNRIHQWAKLNKISLRVESAWSDHFSDFDMLSMSANRYWIGDEQLQKLIMEHDPEANFLYPEK